MNATEKITDRQHIAECPQPGFRYGATIRSNKITQANGTAGKVVMLCKNTRCGAARIV